MLATSENPEWIAGQLGHTSTQLLFQRYTRFIPNVTRRDGTAFLCAYRRWFGSKGEGGAAAAMVNDERTRGGPLGAFCDTFTTPQQKKGSGDSPNPLNGLVAGAGFEPATFGL
jgi:hypothetical protein